MNKTAKFNIGDVVLHKHHGYRARVIDVDPVFQASGRYSSLASKKPFAQRHPWYRLVVDGRRQETYVEECYLLPAPDEQPTDHSTLRHLRLKRFH